MLKGKISNSGKFFEFLTKAAAEGKRIECLNMEEIKAADPIMGLIEILMGPEAAIRKAEEKMKKFKDPTDVVGWIDSFEGDKIYLEDETAGIKSMKVITNATYIVVYVVDIEKTEEEKVEEKIEEFLEKKGKNKFNIEGIETAEDIMRWIEKSAIGGAAHVSVNILGDDMTINTINGELRVKKEKDELLSLLEKSKTIKVLDIISGEEKFYPESKFNMVEEWVNECSEDAEEIKIDDSTEGELILIFNYKNPKPAVLKIVKVD